MANRRIIHHDIGPIYYYVLREQSFDETVRQLTESKKVAENEGYFDFTLWFSCEDSSIHIKAKRYETDLEYSRRLLREEENKSTEAVRKKEKEEQEKKLYEELKQKYENKEEKDG